MNGINPIFIQIVNPQTMEGFPTPDSSERLSDVLLYPMRQAWGGTFEIVQEDLATRYHFDMNPKSDLIGRIQQIAWAIIAIVTTLPGLLFYSLSTTRKQANEKAFLDLPLQVGNYGDALDNLIQRVGSEGLEGAKTFCDAFEEDEVSDELAAKIMEYHDLLQGLGKDDQSDILHSLRRKALGEDRFRQIGANFYFDESKFGATKSAAWDRVITPALQNAQSQDAESNEAYWVRFCGTESVISLTNLLSFMSKMFDRPGVQILARTKTFHFSDGEEKVNGLDLWIINRSTDEKPNTSEIAHDVFVELMASIQQGKGREGISDERAKEIFCAARELNLERFLDPSFKTQSPYEEE